MDWLPAHRVLSAIAALTLPYISLLSRASARPVTPGDLGAGVGITSKFSLSPDGTRAIFQTNKGQAFIDVATGKLANVAPAWFAVGDQVACAWSPTGDRLAVVVYREGLATLQIWQASDGAMREVFALPRALYYRLPAVWSPDGRTLYFVVNQNLPWARTDPRDDNSPTADNNVTLESSGRYDLTVRRERFVREYPEAYAESNRSLIYALDVATGRAGVLGKGNDIETLYLSPDGRHLLAAQPKQAVPGREARWTKQVLVDLYLFATAEPATLPTIDLEKLEDRAAGWSDARDQRVEPLLRDLHLNTTARFLPPLSSGNDGQPILSWSPDSTRFAFATVGRQSTGDVFVYDVVRRALLNLTEKVTLPLVGPKTLGYAEHYSFNYNSHKFGGFYPPRWTPDSRTLLVTGAGDAWALPADGSAAPRNLTAAVPDEARAIVDAGRSGVVALDAAGRLAVITKDRASRLDGLWTVSLDGGVPVRRAEFGAWTDMNFATDMRGELLVVAGQAPRGDTNLRRVALRADSAPVALTRFRANLDQLEFPEKRILSWKTPDGLSAFGVLTLPAGASADRKVPLVLTGYPGSPISQIDTEARAGARAYTESIDTFIQDGIAVFEPDLPISDEGSYAHVMREVVAAVNAATDAALATGVIDEKRLGIEGASFGGFMVQAVVAQTDRFKAAVAIAGVSNWASNYLGAGTYGPRYHEQGQGRLVEPLWADPARYLENSPLAYWDRVHTPLLLIHGEQDSTVPIERSEESLRGLQHLGRDGVLARYRRMGHEPNPEARQRIRAWFREHLLGQPARAHRAALGSFLLGGNGEPTPPPSSSKTP